MDKSGQVDVIYLHYAKAFNTVLHSDILVKFKKFDIKGKLLNWFADYLNNRSQKVAVDGALSNYKPVLSGIPPGSILGPMQFLVFINDTPTCTTAKTTLALFAGDSKCYQAIFSRTDAITLQNDLTE